MEFRVVLGPRMEGILPFGDFSKMVTVFEKCIAGYIARDENVRDQLKACEKVELCLTVADKKTMAEYNGRYRGLNEPTDVIAFPLWENERGDFAPPERWDAVFVSEGDVGGLPLGDVIVCSEVVAENAQTNAVDPCYEMFLVMVHGALHLMGWDHDTDERERDMWREQSALADECTRELQGGLM